MRKFVKNEKGFTVLDGSFDNIESAYRALAEFIEENNLSCPDGDDDALHVDMIEKVEDHGYHDHIDFYYLVDKKFDSCHDKRRYEMNAERITISDRVGGSALYRFVDAGLDASSSCLVTFALRHYGPEKYSNIATFSIFRYENSGYIVDVSREHAAEEFRTKYFEEP